VINRQTLAVMTAYRRFRPAVSEPEVSAPSAPSDAAPPASTGGTPGSVNWPTDEQLRGEVAFNGILGFAIFGYTGFEYDGPGMYSNTNTGLSANDDLTPPVKL
jgi:hypothetical protein